MKLEEFQSILAEKNCDFALFCSPYSEKISSNMFYFSNYKGIGALIVPKKSNPFLVVPEMEYQKAKKTMINKVYLMEKSWTRRTMVS